MPSVLTGLVCVVFLILCNGCVSESASISEADVQDHQRKVVSKRYDLDFQTCVENFDILKDNIIRTQDSRAMGAKYINEVDVNSREDCLRLCCETSTCDVFVFEEKNPGSCYLFHCGSPDDFKCQFTKHHNYTSAVLAINRHLTELENQIKLTKHEHELTRLRKPEPNTVTPFVATTLVPPPKETIQLVPSSSNSTSGRHCSRFQFECRTSGECIGIYNACDGIPQCKDGSDEASELDCPALVSTQPSALAQPTQSISGAKLQLEPASPPEMIPPYSNQQQQALSNINQQSAIQYANGAAENLQLPYNSNAESYVHQQNWLPQQQIQQAQSYEGMPHNSNGIGLNSNQKMNPMMTKSHVKQQEQQILQQQHQQHKEQLQQQQIQRNKLYGREGEGPAFNGNNNQQWQVYQQTQQIPPAPLYQQGPMSQFQAGDNREYDDQNSHIFNHKGNGLVADSDRYKYKGIHPHSIKNPGTQYSEMPHNEYKYGNNGPNNYYGPGTYRQPPANWQSHQLPLQDINSAPPLEDGVHMNENERNSKPGPDGLRGYNGQPVPPDYYYEDSQEGRFHGPIVPHQHQTESQHHHSPAQGHPVHQDSSDAVQVDKSKEKHLQKHTSSLEAKLEEDIDSESKRKEPNHPHIPHTQTTPTTEGTTVKTDVTKVNHEHKTSHMKKTPKVEVNLEEVGLNETIEEPGRPSGAILSLALGLCITGIMVVLIGCRLRVVRRRFRRNGKSPYAHDADYLVNGMYL